jgi:hypothetical protein
LPSFTLGCGRSPRWDLVIADFIWHQLMPQAELGNPLEIVYGD